MITITASIGVYFFINSSVNDLQNSGFIDNSPLSDNSNLILVSITGNKAIVRNDGTSPVREMVIFINGEALEYALSEPIMPGEIREINYASQLAGQDLKIEIVYNNKKLHGVSPSNINMPSSGFEIDCETTNYCFFTGSTIKCPRVNPGETFRLSGTAT